MVSMFKYPEEPVGLTGSEESGGETRGGRPVKVFE